MNANEAFKIFNHKCDVYDYICISREKGMEGCIEYIQQLTGCDVDTAKQMIEEHPNTHPSNFYASPAEIARANAEELERQRKPKCPTCGSTNLKKISATSKAINTAVFGIFGTKRYKQFHCNNCGADF